ncbi:hypothetical protein [Mycobacterium sp. AZCC_0083]|uniref:hypothetical protein n=1 Tax=Mycobacterium sp. AZCC_0083 TaxID=2735882 RepID=UPI00161D0AE9|nr:hypothetical protein [Mycobacterium sp. AZCC_0083]MBB5164131.1 hypothetical protein [Mycobacterium sp. AZCC_0083]
MYLSAYHISEDRLPVVESSAPARGESGRERPAYISIYPFGEMPESGFYLDMSLDEAEVLGRHISQIVTAARNGRFTHNH